MKSLNRFYIFFTLLLFITLFSIITVFSRPEVCGYIDKVVDGDTVWISVEDILDSRFGNLSGESFKVRFADVNAPELSTPEGLRSRDALLKLINEYGNFACLDIDDRYIYDKYGRVVAILYLNYNETHLINVNQYLVDNGYTEYVDYQNEFGESSFQLYIAKEGMVTDGDIPDIYLLLLLALVVVIYIAKRKKIQL